MSSLKHCLTKIGLQKHEAAILRGAVKELTDEGYAAHEAAVTAVKDYISELEGERASIVKQVQEQAAKQAADMRSQVEAAQAREAGEQRARDEARWQELMRGSKADVQAVVGRMTKAEAKAALDRLDAAPGDNATVRAALNDRLAVISKRADESDAAEAQGFKFLPPNTWAQTVRGSDRSVLFNIRRAGEKYRLTRSTTMDNAPQGVLPSIEVGLFANMADALSAFDAELSKIDGAAPKKEKIVDVGEKIGGARKDTSTSTGPRGTADKDEAPGWRKRYTVSQIVKSTKAGEEGRWVIGDSRSKDYFGQPRRVGNSFATKEEAEAAVPLAEVARNHRVGYTKVDGAEKYVIWRNVTDHKRVQVVQQLFDSADDAKQYMAEHAVEIIETKTSFGEEILPRPDTVVRKGAKRRSGDVVGDDFKDAFGFRGVEFGNWESQDERQAVMNHAFDALMDLADVLGVPPRALGLNGELALAFGARGQGLIGARAHYERDYGVINLTKMKGAGSLAHEWLHAADHYFGRQDSKASSERVKNERGDLVFKTRGREDDYASHGLSSAERSKMRAELREAYTELIKTMMSKAEQYVEDTQKADRFVAETRNDLATKLKQLRDNLARKAEYGSRREPANAKQLARFDEIADKMLAGEYLELQFLQNEAKGRRARFGGSFRWSNDGIDALSAIYKEVRNRSGFDSQNRGGIMDELGQYARRYGERLKMLADAKASTTKERRVPTSFATEAKRIDQGRVENYWSTPHEMAARAFQSYVEDKIDERGGRSDFLTYGTNTAIPTPWGWARPFPTGEERQSINTAFDKFVTTLRTRETDKGVALESRGAGAGLSVDRVRQIVADKLGAEAVAALERSGVLDIREDNAGLGVGTEETDGLYDPRARGGLGTAYLFSGRLTEGSVLPVLMEELGEHYGLQAALGEDGYAQLVKRVGQLRRDGYGPAVSAWSEVVETYEQFAGRDDADLAADPAFMHEVIAKLGRDKAVQERPWWRDVLAKIKAFLLRTLGVTAGIDETDIGAFIEGAARRAAGRARVAGGEAMASKRTPIFYSALRRAIDGLNAKAMTAADWQERIKALVGKQGVKADEIEWSGINDWIWAQAFPADAASASGKITKQQVLAYLDANGMPLFSIINDAVAFARKVDDFLRGLVTERFVRVTSTPDVLRALGYADRSIEVSPRILQKALREEGVDGGKHGLPVAAVKAIARGLHDPVAVFQSEHEADTVMLALEQEVGGLPIVVGVRKADNRVTINSISTIYDGKLTKLERWTDDGLLRYLHTEKRPAWLTGRGAQLHKAMSAKRGVDRNVMTQADVVKRGQQPLESRIRKSRQVEPDFAKGMTPAQKETLRKAGFIHEEPTLAGRASSLLESFRKEFVQGVFDQFAPLKELSMRAYKLARMASSSDGSVEALLFFGKPFMTPEGGVDVKIAADGKGGFLHVLQGLNGEHDRFMAWVAGNRAAMLKEQGRENLFTDDDISFLRDLNAGKMKDGRERTEVYKDALEKLQAFNNAALDIAERSGLFDAESRKLWAQQFYVPFYRVLEEGIGGPSIKSGLVNQYGIKKLKGGTAELNDLLKNTLMNWAHLMSASAKNRAAKESAEELLRLGGAIEADEATIRSMGKAAGEKAVSFLDNGVRRWLLIEDRMVFDALSALNWGGFGPVMKPMQTMKRWLTFGVTISPTFKTANLIRDSLSAIGTSPVSYNPFKNLLEGWQATARNSQGYASMLAGGGMFRFGTSLEGDRAQHLKRLVEAGIKDWQVLDTAEKFAAFGQKLWDMYQDIGDRSENVNRAAIYEQLRAKGYSHLDASYAARDLMDFSLQGKWALIRFLVQVVPFMNARLQGLYKLGRASAEDRARFGIVVGAVSLASIGLMLMNGDDEEWRRQEDWMRDTYWWVRIGGHVVLIPKPFEIGALGTLAERSLELLIDKDMTAKRYMQRISDMFANTFAMSPVPQAVKPLLDVYANKDSFTNRPIESPGMERLRPQDRYTGTTSETARLLGSLGLPQPSELMQGKYEPISPVQADHLMRGYFGSLAVGLNMLVDAMFRPLMGRPEKPTRGVTDVPLVGRFVRELPTGQSRYVTEFYDEARRLEQGFATYRDALKRGDKEAAAEIRADVGDEELRRGAAAARYRDAMASLNLQRRRIETDKALDAREKRDRILEIRDRQEKLARQFVARTTAPAATQ